MFPGQPHAGTQVARRTDAGPGLTGADPQHPAQQGRRVPSSDFRGDTAPVQFGDQGVIEHRQPAELLFHQPGDLRQGPGRDRGERHREQRVDRAG